MKTNSYRRNQTLFLPAPAGLQISKLPFSRGFLHTPWPIRFPVSDGKDRWFLWGKSAAALLFCYPLFLPRQEQRLSSFGWLFFSCLHPQAELGTLTDCKTYSLLFLIEYIHAFFNQTIFFPGRFLHPPFSRCGIKICGAVPHFP